MPYALLKVFLWKRVDEFLFPIALALVAGSCWCTQLGWTPIPSEQGPPIPYEYQIFAWSLWIGGFLAIVPGIGHVWNKHVTSRQGAAVSTIFGFFLSYALSLLATSLGNWTRDGAGWHLNDAGFSKQTFCYSVFLIAGAILAHSVSSLVVAGFQLCRLGSHFPPAIVLTGLSWVRICCASIPMLGTPRHQLSMGPLKAHCCKNLSRLVWLTSRRAGHDYSWCILCGGARWAWPLDLQHIHAF